MTKVLIVDDSMLFSNLLKRKLSEYPDIFIVGTAYNPYQARDLILETEPDVVTLDIEMPRMDGVSFLKKLLPQYPIPVIMISSLEARKAECEAAGALSFRVKPSLSDDGDVNLFIKRVVADIRSVKVEPASAPASTPKATAAPKPATSPKMAAGGKVTKAEIPKSAGTGGIYNRNGFEIIALGASTGGTDALEIVVKGLTKECPPVIITQHMPPVFTRMYSERLNRTTPLAVFEAVDGMRLEKGMCVIAEGGKHLQLHKDARGYYISSREGDKVSGHCPSVDVMFTSAAAVAGNKVVAALLTGMGADGAKGMLALKNAGAYTIGQNEETCVVYGMPMEAYKLGAVCEETALDNISRVILKKMLLQG